MENKAPTGAGSISSFKDKSCPVPACKMNSVSFGRCSNRAKFNRIKLIQHLKKEKMITVSMQSWQRGADQDCVIIISTLGPLITEKKERMTANANRLWPNNWCI